MFSLFTKRSISSYKKVRRHPWPSFLTILNSLWKFFIKIFILQDNSCPFDFYFGHLLWETIQVWWGIGKAEEIARTIQRDEALRIYRFAETTTRKGTKRANGTEIKLKKFLHVCLVNGFISGVFCLIFVSDSQDRNFWAHLTSTLQFHWCGWSEPSSLFWVVTLLHI